MTLYLKSPPVPSVSITLVKPFKISHGKINSETLFILANMEGFFFITRKRMTEELWIGICVSIDFPEHL